jgi:hypothetical protein
MASKDIYAFCDHLSLDQIGAALRDHSNPDEVPFEEKTPLGSAHHRIGVILTSHALLQKRIADLEITLGEISPMIDAHTGVTFPYASTTDFQGNKTVIIPEEIERELHPDLPGKHLPAKPYNGGNIVSRFIHAYEEAHHGETPLFFSTIENTQRLSLLT